MHAQKRDGLQQHIAQVRVDKVLVLRKFLRVLSCEVIELESLEQPHVAANLLKLLKCLELAEAVSPRVHELF